MKKPFFSVLIFLALITLSHNGFSSPQTAVRRPIHASFEIHRLHRDFERDKIDWTSQGFIKLNDNSVWEFAPISSTHIPSWSSKELLYITQNEDSASNTIYPYLIFNASNNAVVPIRLIKRPYEPSSLKLKHISLEDKPPAFVATDDAIWEIYEQDFEVVKTWKNGDVIIYGSNKKASSPSDEPYNIAINESLPGSPYIRLTLLLPPIYIDR